MGVTRRRDQTYQPGAERLHHLWRHLAHASVVDDVEGAMADSEYVGKHRDPAEAPPPAHRPARAGTRMAAAVAMIGIVSVVGGAVGTRALSQAKAAAAPRAASAPVTTTTTHVVTTVPSRGAHRGRLVVHVDSPHPTRSAIAGDEGSRRLTWTLDVANGTGTTVTIGDPTAVLWTTDGSGHVAVTRDVVRPGSRRATPVSFDLPMGLDPSSITLTVGSLQTELTVAPAAGR
jgi:hypothetical protein